MLRDQNTLIQRNASLFHAYSSKMEINMMNVKTFALSALAFSTLAALACNSEEPLTGSQMMPEGAEPPPQAGQRASRFAPAPLPDSVPAWGRCLPTLSYGPLLYINSSLRVAAYGSTRPDRFLLERYGSTPRTALAELSPLKSRLSDQLFAIPGITSHGIGYCSTSQPVDTMLCIRVDAQIIATTLPSLTDQIGQLLKEEGDSCIGVDITVRGWEAPRCEASDPQCLPLPYCEGDICQGAPYRPGAGRYLVPEAGGVSEGSCQADGDCQKNGNSCISYTSYELYGTAVFHGGLQSAFCGCVQGRCNWFKQ